MLIVEYCRFGDLRSFLVNSRNNFVNQVDEFGQLKVENVTEERGRERTEIQQPILTFTNETFEMNEIPSKSSIPNLQFILF